MSLCRSRKRRDRHVDDVEPVIEILAEAAGGDLVGEAAVGGGDDADVDGLGDAAADALDLAGLERAEQFDLGVERQLADLVEEDGRAVGILEAADMAVEGAGEGALLMAEQDRFDEIGGDGAAIDGVELLLAARAGGVDRLGDDLLARAALALDQHRDAGAGGLGGDGERGAELGRRADDLLEAQRLADLLGERPQLARRLAAVGGGVERGEQPVGRERLDDEIAGAGAHRVDRDMDVVLGGEDEQGQIGPERADAADQLDALLAGQPVIEQDRVELGLLRDPSSICAARRRSRRRRAPTSRRARRWR